MKTFLHSVTALGDILQTPDFPQRPLSGQLYLETTDLAFYPSDRSAPIKIPIANLRRCGSDEGRIGGLEGAVWSLLTPLTVLSLGLLSGIYTYVWVVYINPRYSSTPFEIHFKVGGIHHRPHADHLARQIWAAIGSQHDSTFTGTKPQRRG